MRRTSAWRGDGRTSTAGTRTRTDASPRTGPSPCSSTGSGRCSPTPTTSSSSTDRLTDRLLTDRLTQCWCAVAPRRARATRVREWSARHGGDALRGLLLHEAEEVAGDTAHLDLFAALGDAVAPVMPVDVLERHVP